MGLRALMWIETMPDMTTLMDREQLVGWIVRDRIMATGLSYAEVSRRWPISLPTLNNLMRHGHVGLRFYRLAEKNLELPEKFLDLVIEGDLNSIRSLDGLNQNLQAYVLDALGETKKRPRRRAPKEA